jgi:hypothetical protein
MIKNDLKDIDKHNNNNQAFYSQASWGRQPNVQAAKAKQ